MKDLDIYYLHLMMSSKPRCTGVEENIRLLPGLLFLKCLNLCLFYVYQFPRIRGCLDLVTCSSSSRMEKLEEIKSVCSEMFVRATEPIVVAPPEFVMEGEVDIPVSMREMVAQAGNSMFPFSLQRFQVDAISVLLQNRHIFVLA